MGKTISIRTDSKQNRDLVPIQEEEEKFRSLFSLRNLRNTWRIIRREAREYSVRDVLDFLDWAVSIEATLPDIQRDILSGRYTPTTPSRYESAKTKGAYRTITKLNIRDVLILRVISDKALELALSNKVKGAFFSRRHQVTPVGNTFTLENDPSPRFFPIWLRYQEYRTRTLLNQPSDILVVTDISNYFDSIAHELLMEYLAPLGLPRKAVGTLGRILEAVKPPAGHSPNPRIGIPVDEFDCSRQLAHIFLFEHDKRIVKEVGEDSYVRWMDDQNIRASSESEARKIVNLLTRSLSSQRLTLNSGKTQFLTPHEVIVHFQLDANEMINEWERKFKRCQEERFPEAIRSLESLWDKISKSPSVDKGSWDKILKRLYACAAKVNSNLLDGRMYDDLVQYPHLADRIFLSLARRNEKSKLYKLFMKYVRDGESLFEDIEALFFNSCLLMDVELTFEQKYRTLAYKFARGEIKKYSGRPYGKAAALLCLYWFGAKTREITDLFSPDEALQLPSPVARAWLAVITAKHPKSLPKIQARLVGYPSDDVARLSRFLHDLLEGTIETVGRYRRQRPRWPASGKFYDARAWLTLELLSWAGSKKLKGTAKSDIVPFEKLTRTRQEKRILNRIKRRITRR